MSLPTPVPISLAPASLIALLLYFIFNIIIDSLVGLNNDDEGDNFKNIKKILRKNKSAEKKIVYLLLFKVFYVLLYFFCLVNSWHMNEL